MDDYLRKLVEAPLANAVKINLPQGRQPARREKVERAFPAPNDLTPAQVRENKAKAISDKRQKLLDYYATVDISAEQVARHIGMFVLVQTGVDEETGKPTYKRELDVKTVEAQLAARRA